MLKILLVFNIAMLLADAIVLFRRRHIANFLFGISLISFILVEVGKLCFLFDNFYYAGRFIGFGLCTIMTIWLIFSSSIVVSKPASWSRGVVAPVLGMVSLVSLLLLWLKPYMFTSVSWHTDMLTPGARYFFILFIINSAVAVSNIERGSTLSKQRALRMLLAGAILLLVPYFVFATFAVLFSRVDPAILLYSSFSIGLGALHLFFVARKGIHTEVLKEDTAVTTSLTLFLVGGYLFFIGAFVKLFQLFGWNLTTLFAFLTTGFVLFILSFLVFSTTTVGRIKSFFFRYFTRQKFDWQKLWEEFTFELSSDTQLESIKKHIKEYIVKIMGVSKVTVEVFDKEIPFEKEFADWMLRRGEAFRPDEIFLNGFMEQFPIAYEFFKERSTVVVSPLFGDKRIIGVICVAPKKGAEDDKQFAFIDTELLRLLSLQASSVIINCWAYQQIADAEKKESLYRLSSFVIHDVKNYVYNISLLLSNKDKFSNPKFQEDALFTLQTTVEKMQKLIEEFRALRGDVVLNREAVTVKSVVNEVIDDLGKNRFETVEVRMNIDDSVTVYADKGYLYKVVLNLLTNSLEAMQENGILQIRVKQDDAMAELVIKDNGKGMSSDFIQKRLFKPFHSTKEKGMGIGLYQCKTIIEAHGGSIEARSKVNKGTTFVIKLPLKKIEDRK